MPLTGGDPMKAPTDGFSLSNQQTCESGHVATATSVQCWWSGGKELLPQHVENGCPRMGVHFDVYRTCGIRPKYAAASILLIENDRPLKAGRSLAFWVNRRN